MAGINDRQIDVLNGLISTTLDSADGYAEAARDARNPRFKSLFDLRATDRRQLSAELQAKVHSLGGKPDDGGSLLGAGHRMFLNLKSAVTGSDESVITEIEGGEGYLKGKYEVALQDDGLSEHVKVLVARVYEHVKADDDQSHNLNRSATA